MTVKLWGDKYPTKASGNEADLLGDDLNDTYELLINTAILTAENAVRVLQANNIYTNGPNIVVDEFTDADGTQGTVNTGSSTAEHKNVDTEYVTKSELGSIGLTDATEYSVHIGASLVLQLIKTYTPTSTRVFKILYDYKFNSNNASLDGATRVIFNYADGYSSYSSPILDYDYATYNNTYINDIEIINPYPARTITSISIYGNSIDAGDDVTSYCKDFKEYESDYSTGGTVIVDTNTTTLDGNELGFAVSIPDSDIPVGTSIGVVVSDGVSSLSSQTIDSTSKGVVIGNNGLSSGSLKLTFTINTTDSSVTATIKDFSCVLLR